MSDGTGSGRIGRILVVDDNAQNRMVAEGHLAAAGYVVLLAESGAAAVQQFEAHTPDLVLLDVVMPGMNGFETCRCLRGLRGGADTAIVFLTSLTDLGSHQEALASGADDFLSKPINRTELLMRVRSLLWVKHLKDDLRQGYDLIRSQRDALLTAQRQKAEFTALLVHDLKNPLSIAVANCRLVLKDPSLSDRGRVSVKDIQSCAEEMNAMVLNLLDISRSEDGGLVPHREPLQLAALLEDRVAAARVRAAEQTTAIVVHALPDLSLFADRELVRRLVENLIDNALKYAPAGATIRVEALTTGDGMIELRVCDEGPGIPERDRERIFDKYVQLQEGGDLVRVSRGLGLAFCRLAVEAHGGRIWVEPNVPHGASFCVRLPLVG